MKLTQLDGLIALKVVSEKKNFTAAAEDLGVSTSAISQSVKQLEKRMGVTLLSRTTRSTSLTEVGQRFLNQAGPAIEQILAAIEEVGNLAQKPSGLLRLNMPRILYPMFFESVIHSFLKKYPDIAVELFFEDVATDVVEKGFDAGIRLSDILAKDVTAIKIIGPVRFVIVGAPKYFNKFGRPKHPKELLGHQCIVPRLEANHLYDRWEFEQKGQEFQVQVKPSLIFNDSLLMLDAAEKGSGVVYSSEDLVRERVKSGKLEIVLNSFSPTSAGFYLYYPQRSQVLPKLRALIDHIKQLKN